MGLFSGLPSLSEQGRVAAPKPRKGDKWLATKATKAERRAHEQREMQAALRRDKRTCRFPRCEFKGMPVDPAHLDHRRMGGNPSGDKTDRTTVLALCRRHHDEFDKSEIDIEPLTKNGTAGPCAYYRRTEAGRWAHVASEKSIRVSEARS